MVTPLNAVQQSCLVLSQGGVVLHPTETCYGFAVDVTNQSAIQKLYRLKKMPLEKPSSIMVSGLEVAEQYGYFSELARQLAGEYWPGPLTLIVARRNLPKFLNPGSETVGIRVPQHDFVLDLLKNYPAPLITTSANVSGKPEAYEISEVLQQLEEKPDFIVDLGRAGGQKPSTILEVSDSHLRLVREGPLGEEILKRYVEYFEH